jgi:hypothetical protein
MHHKYTQGHYTEAVTSIQNKLHTLPKRTSLYLAAGCASEAPRTCAGAVMMHNSSAAVGSQAAGVVLTHQRRLHRRQVVPVGWWRRYKTMGQGPDHTLSMQWNTTVGQEQDCTQGVHQQGCSRLHMTQVPLACLSPSSLLKASPCCTPPSHQKGLSQGAMIASATPCGGSMACSIGWHMICSQPHTQMPATPPPAPVSTPAYPQ